VSTAADETDPQLVCGTAAMPADGPTDGPGADAAGRLLAWSHGTQGVDQRCLPSGDPSRYLWGPMPAGIQAVSFGAFLGKHEGRPADGLLQHAVDRGWLVSATDYQPDTYAIGRVAAANVLDASRAATQLAARTFGDTPARYDLVTYGHSQGGHAALWAGQLAESYLTGTEPARPTAELRPVGVAALAPASNFIAQPDLQPGLSYGDGLADQDMHRSVPLLTGVPIPGLELQIGPALFSYIFGTWRSFSAAADPVPGARFPAAPAEAGELRLDAVATDEGISTIEGVRPLCLFSEGSEIKQLTAPYRDAEQHRMLVPDLWNLPRDYRTGQFFAGGVDRTCDTGDDRAMSSWCRWIRWNLPGPLADNPFPKWPAADDEPLPLLVGQGTADTIIRCVAPDGLPTEAVPPATDCMSTALYESLRDQGYCPDADDPAGHLDYLTVREVPLVSPASHLSLPGELSARTIGRSQADLSFQGSPLERFLTGAFDRSLEPGCRARVLNPRG
jgi:hypothetical protein